MIKFLIGGSPCTHWSIAQSKNRETKAEGIGWELFKNYLIAREKFEPDFFLYENNKSAAKAIKDQISLELGEPLQYINSALVSAQNRQRFYCHNFGDVPQPEDRGILLKDILETGVPFGDSNSNSYCLTASYTGAVPHDTLIKCRKTMVAEPLCTTLEGKSFCVTATEYKGSNPQQTLSKHRRTMVAEPFCIAQRGRYTGDAGCVQQNFEPRADGKTNTLTTVKKDNMVAWAVGEQIILSATNENKAQCLRASCYKDGIRNLVGNNVDRRTCIAQPVRSAPVAIDYNPLEGCDVVISESGIRCSYKNGAGTAQGYHVQSVAAPKSRCLLAGQAGREKVIVPCEEGTDLKPIYRVEGGQIEIKGKTYPIKLPDGFYIIRKLTVTECCRLQTMPDDYCRAVSATQGYKGLGNGWTAEVIIHLLSHALKGVPKDEEIVVLSMYDGIGTGRYCFDRLGYKNITYHAYEIDKYAMQVAIDNFPDIVQHGDAFDIRKPNWKMG